MSGQFVSYGRCLLSVASFAVHAMQRAVVTLSLPCFFERGDLRPPVYSTSCRQYMLLLSFRPSNNFSLFSQKCHIFERILILIYTSFHNLSAIYLPIMNANIAIFAVIGNIYPCHKQPSPLYHLHLVRDARFSAQKPASLHSGESISLFFS